MIVWTIGETAVLAPPHGWQGMAFPLPQAEFSASKWEPGGTDRKHKLSFRTNETNCTVSGDCSLWPKKPKIAAEEPKSYTPVRTSQHHAKTPTTPSVARSRQDDRFHLDSPEWPSGPNRGLPWVFTAATPTSSRATPLQSAVVEGTCYSTNRVRSIRASLFWCACEHARTGVSRACVHEHTRTWGVWGGDIVNVTNRRNF